jgi:hyperosmotically inducible protein
MHPPILWEGRKRLSANALTNNGGYMKKLIHLTAVAALAAAWLATPARTDQAPATPPALNAQVRRQLLRLPFYSVFDDLTYAVNGDTVTLSGQVTRPTLKSDAEAVVKRIAGVGAVVNQIEVLPLSPADTRLRWAAYRALFHPNSPLLRYGLGADPAIHIIVENGHLTLKGTVSSEADKQIAGMYMRSVPGFFSVTNDLKVSPAGTAAAS